MDFEITIKLSELILFLFFMGIFFIGFRMLHDWFRVARLYEEGLVWIEDHRARIKGDNRFPVGENYFAQAFPEYPPKITHRVWLKYVRENRFVSDPMDGQWCIARSI